MFSSCNSELSELEWTKQNWLKNKIEKIEFFHWISVQDTEMVKMIQ